MTDVEAQAQALPSYQDVDAITPARVVSGDSYRDDKHAPRPIAEGDVLTEHERRNLSRGLKQRHLSMVALAGGSFSSLRVLAERGVAADTQAPLEPDCSWDWEGQSRRADPSVRCSVMPSSGWWSAPSSLRWEK